jgi:catechol 2,3-dioxygenase-like lactoylglutathione lyase family enzyme
MMIEIVGDLTEETPTPYAAGGAVEFLAKYGPGIDHLCFEVEDMDEACKELESEGLKIETGPYDFGGFARLAWLKDPAGVNVELIEYLR